VVTCARHQAVRPSNPRARRCWRVTVSFQGDSRSARRAGLAWAWVRLVIASTTTTRHRRGAKLAGLAGDLGDLRRTCSTAGELAQ
jgi:hypothetical protein